MGRAAGVRKPLGVVPPAGWDWYFRSASVRAAERRSRMAAESHGALRARQACPRLPETPDRGSALGRHRRLTRPRYLARARVSVRHQIAGLPLRTGRAAGRIGRAGASKGRLTTAGRSWMPFWCRMRTHRPPITTGRGPCDVVCAARNRREPKCRIDPWARSQQSGAGSSMTPTASFAPRHPGSGRRCGICAFGSG
jgi:hypothetical protein